MFSVKFYTIPVFLTFDAQKRAGNPIFQPLYICYMLLENAG